MGSSCNFGLRFPDGEWWWASFPCFHQCVFFRDVSVQVLCPFLNFDVCVWTCINFARSGCQSRVRQVMCRCPLLCEGPSTHRLSFWWGLLDLSLLWHFCRALSVEDAVLSPASSLGPLGENPVAICARVYFWAFVLIHWPVCLFMPPLHWLEYHSSVGSSELRKCESWGFHLCSFSGLFWLLWSPLRLLTNVRKGISSFVKSVFKILIRILLNL